MLIYLERIKEILIGLNQRRFTGKLTIDIYFKQGGIYEAYSKPEEKIDLAAAK